MDGVNHWAVRKDHANRDDHHPGRLAHHDHRLDHLVLVVGARFGHQVSGVDVDVVVLRAAATKCLQTIMSMQALRATTTTARAMVRPLRRR